MKKIICLAGIALLTVTLMAGTAVSVYEKAPEQMKGLAITVIMGTINNFNQLVDINGQTFNVAVNGESMKLFNHIGKKVLVSGAVMELDGKKQITILEYKLIPENPDY